MTWIETIRQKPRAAKMKIIWTVAATIAILMLAVWIISAKFQKNTTGDTSVFQDIGQEMHNLKENYRK